ncbi:hypothetical protein RP20_CCG027129 [Aedes albopictus]|nr:hypothetical protein RP20_CCG027129 [Aedes albopictus]
MLLFWSARAASKPPKWHQYFAPSSSLFLLTVMIKTQELKPHVKGGHQHHTTTGPFVLLACRSNEYDNGNTEKNDVVARSITFKIIARPGAVVDSRNFRSNDARKATTTPAQNESPHPFH